MDDLLTATLDSLETIVWVTDPRRGIRPERSRALAAQIARNAIAALRAPRLVWSASSASGNQT